MPDKRYTIISVNVSTDERETVNQLAKDRGYKFTSDYLRALIEADAAAHGVNFKFDVDRGGYRGDKGE